MKVCPRHDRHFGNDLLRLPLSLPRPRPLP
jgi:hypothetical protein